MESNLYWTKRKKKQILYQSVSIHVFGLSHNFYEGLISVKWAWNGYVIDDSIPILLHAFNEHGLNRT